MLQKPRRFCACFCKVGNLTGLAIAFLGGLLWGMFFASIFLPFLDACKLGSLVGSGNALLGWLPYTLYRTWAEIRPKPPPLQVTYQPVYPDPTIHDMTNIVFFPTKHDISRRDFPSSAA
jgi:hypothetical protein